MATLPKNDKQRRSFFFSGGPARGENCEALALDISGALVEQLLAVRTQETEDNQRRPKETERYQTQNLEAWF